MRVFRNFMFFYVSYGRIWLKTINLTLPSIWMYALKKDNETNLQPKVISSELKNGRCCTITWMVSNIKVLKLGVINNLWKTANPGEKSDFKSGCHYYSNDSEAFWKDELNVKRYREKERGKEREFLLAFCWSTEREITF